MGSKKIQVWLPLLFAIVMVIGMIIGFQLKGKMPGNQFLTINRRSSLQELSDLINNKYVDRVSTDSINQLVAGELLAHLDPHSVYIPATDLREMDEDLMGNYEGIGIEFQVLHDTVNVVNVMADGPSAKAGVLLGDKLLKVGDTGQVAGKNSSVEHIRKLLRGPAHTPVTVQFLRDGQLKNIVITRGVIPVSPIDAAYMIASQTGFIRISKFADRTYEAFMQSMEKLQKQGMKELVLDLRGNGGGLLAEATAIADEFLSEDKLIVYTQGEHVPRFEYHCKRDGLFETGKLVVLIDETSASASEVLSGALQDWDRATIVGRRSFGKGLVQQQFQLTDGSAVRLTVARYYSPLGRNIQKPYSKGKEKYDAELLDRFHNGELEKIDSTKHDKKVFKTPGGRMVYGGGGITPDVFVPADTTHSQPVLLKLYYRNTMGNFIYQYYVTHKKTLDGITAAGSLPGMFMSTENDWQSFASFAQRDSISFVALNGDEKDYIRHRLQGLMARQLWHTEGYYELLNRNDVTVQKALGLLK